MITKERLDLMEEIKRKNDAAWSKYARQPRQRWTWDMDVKRQFRPFDRIGMGIVLMACFPLLLVLIVLMV